MFTHIWRKNYNHQGGFKTKWINFISMCGEMGGSEIYRENCWVILGNDYLDPNQSPHDFTRSTMYKTVLIAWYMIKDFRAVREHFVNLKNHHESLRFDLWASCLWERKRKIYLQLQNNLFTDELAVNELSIEALNLGRSRVFWTIWTKKQSITANRYNF